MAGQGCCLSDHHIFIRAAQEPSPSTRRKLGGQGFPRAPLSSPSRSPLTMRAQTLPHCPLCLLCSGGRKCASSVKLDLNTDFSKLRVSQLKEILRTAGEGCTGCVEKDDFVKAVKLLISSNAA